MKTTKAHYLAFMKYAKEWRVKLGLTNWAVYYAHGKTEGSYAETGWKTSAAVAAITLSTDWDDFNEPTLPELRRLALHEMLHVLMAQLISEAQDRYATQLAIETAEHSIIRQLEEVILTRKG